MRAAGFLVRQGPATQQERWEEASGYSPSTLAAVVAALICAAGFLRQRGDELTAQFLGEYADFVEVHLKRWTVTTAGTLVPGIPRHFVRICPAAVGDPQPETGLKGAARRNASRSSRSPIPAALVAG
jgi:glucoamylase